MKQGKILIPGIDNGLICTTSDAKNNGYMSGSAVSNFILKTVLGGSYRNEGGVELHRDCFDYVKSVVDKFKFGDGHSIKYYYNQEQVVKAVADFINNGNKAPSELNVKVMKFDTSSAYISKHDVIKMLTKLLTSFGFNEPTLSTLLKKEMRIIKDTVTQKKYKDIKYSFDEVNAYIENLRQKYIKVTNTNIEPIEVYTKEELRKLGYFSGTVVGDNLYKHLQALGFSGQELLKVYKKEMSNLRNSVKKKTIGEGRATKHYYDLVGVNDFMFELTKRYEG